MSTKLTVFNEVLRELGIKNALTDTTTVNTRQAEIDGRFNEAVKYVLSQDNWNFARARATLTGSASSAFPPYTYVNSKPANWLRTTWIRNNAYDAVEVDSAEVGSSIYTFATPTLIEYISGHADNYDPANWTPLFTRAVVLYIAFLVAPGLARAGDDVTNRLYALYEQALDTARSHEARFLTNEQIPANRHVVFQRALELLGQGLAGSVPINNHNGKLYWQMNQSWSHGVLYCLELGAWNFASRRARLTGGTQSIPGGEVDDITEGYSVAPAAAATETTTAAISEYDYGYQLPDDFLHKIMVKRDAYDDLDCNFQILGSTIMANYEPLILEYVSKDDDAINPDKWPATFKEVVSAHLAGAVVPEVMMTEGMKQQKVTLLEAKRAMTEIFMAKLADAKRKDAIQQASKAVPLGSFARARMGSGVRPFRSRY